MKLDLKHVHYMPKTLEPGVLYVSREFNTAAHLCACGCGAKIRTPLTPTEWTLEETPSGPTLRPSIGNWQQECKSHYVISRGDVIWAEKWTSEQIVAGRRREEKNRINYYRTRERQNSGTLKRLWIWLARLFGK